MKVSDFVGLTVVEESNGEIDDGKQETSRFESEKLSDSELESKGSKGSNEGSGNENQDSQGSKGKAGRKRRKHKKESI